MGLEYCYDREAPEFDRGKDRKERAFPDVFIKNNMCHVTSANHVTLTTHRG